MQPDGAGGQLTKGSVVAGRYGVETLIGRGGMAEVYRAFDERLQRKVALKVLRARLAGNLGLRTRFEEEARAAAMVSHRNVVAIYDAGEDEDKAFIVMELVDGSTLAEQIGQGPLGNDEVRRTGGEVLDGLAAAHSRGVLHRDVKPANVLCAKDGTLKVADFGIAKAVHPSPDGEPTTMNIVFGTPSYLAPERAQGHPATVRSDLWSVGVMLYECLTGTKPFEGDNPIAVTMAAQKGDYKPIRELAAGADPAIVSVIERALRADPAERFTSASEMARFLRNPAADPRTLVSPLATALLDEPTEMMWNPWPTARTTAAGAAVGAAAGVAQPIERQTRRWPRLNVPAVLAAAAVLVLLAGFTGLALSSGQRPPKAPAHSAKTISTTKPRLTSGGSTTTTTDPPTTTTTVPPIAEAPPAANPPPGGQPVHFHNHHSKGPGRSPGPAGQSGDGQTGQQD